MSVAQSGRTVLRAVTVPVAAPVDMDWKKLDGLLKPAFEFSTDLANWAVHTLFKKDAPNEHKTPDSVRLKSKTNVNGCYLYGEASTGFPEWAERSQYATRAATCVLRTVHKKYLNDRYNMMVRHDHSLTTYKFPYPFPIHNQDWSITFDSSGSPVISVPLPSVGKVALRLKTGNEFRRQLGMLRQFVDGTAKKGEASLLRNHKGTLMVKMVGHFPVQERTDSTNVCFLHTDPNALLVAEINGRSVTVTNGDHLKRAHAVIRETASRHKRMLQRISEDKKREARMDREQRAALNRKVESRCNKQRNRMHTAVQQIAAQVARFCERQRVALIAYDDSIKNFLPGGFQWHALRTRMCQLFVGEMGGEWIDGQFTHLKTREEREQWLRTTQMERAEASAKALKRQAAHKQRKGSHPAVTPKTTAKPKTSKTACTKPSCVSAQTT